MGEAGSSDPLVPYHYSSQEEEETALPKKRLKSDSLGEKSCDGGSSHSFLDEVHNQTNLGDNINPKLEEALSSDDEAWDDEYSFIVEDDIDAPPNYFSPYEDEPDDTPKNTKYALAFPWLEKDEKTQLLPIEQQPCDSDCNGAKLSSGGVYLPFLRERKMFIDTDDELLNWEWGFRLAFEDPDRLELYHIVFEHKDECVESKCLELLKQIGCEERFSCCSIQTPGVFFAWLTPKEAEKLNDVKEIVRFEIRRKMVFFEDR